MKTAVLLGAGMFGLFSLTGFELFRRTEKAENRHYTISAQEAKDMMEKGGVTILDVRTAEEFADGWIPGAVNLPNEEIGGEELELLDNKEAVLLIYCRSGRRSREAARKLARMGYTQVYDFGGIMDWTYETVKEE